MLHRLAFLLRGEAQMRERSGPRRGWVMGYICGSLGCLRFLKGGSKSVSTTVMCFMCQLTPALPTGMANQNLGDRLTPCKCTELALPTSLEHIAEAMEIGPPGGQMGK